MRSVLFLLAFLVHGPAARAIDSEDILRAYLQTGQSKDALEAFRSMTAENPNDSLGHAWAGYLSLSLDTPGEALDSFLGALETGRYRPEAVLYLHEAMKLADTRERSERVLETLARVAEARDTADHVRDAARFAQGRLLQRLGKWDEAKSAFEPMQFVKSSNFLICGPFDNAEKGGHDRSYGPETTLDRDAVHPGRHREVGWRHIMQTAADGYVDLHALVSPSNESSAYLLTVIQSSRAQRARIHFGHGGALKAWLNGTLIADVNRYHPPQPDQVNVRERLSEGSNTLLIKVSSGETGKFGVYTRVVPEYGDTLAYPIHPASSNRISIPEEHAPRPDQDPPAMEELEPVALRQLKALGESMNAKPQHHLFYALLVQALDVADEFDNSANSMISQLNQLYDGNPLLVRWLGDTEKEVNRRRMAYERALELDPDDRMAALGLLRYFRESPYAAKGFELYETWKKRHDPDPDMIAEYAQLLESRGMREAAARALEGIPEEQRSHAARWLLHRYKSPWLASGRDESLKAVLDHNAMAMEALRELQGLCIEREEWDRFSDTLFHEWKIDPFSVDGLLDVLRHYIAAGEYEKLFDNRFGRVDGILDRSPDHFEANKLAAVARHAMGEDANALKHLRSALNARPSDPWCLEYLEFLNPEGGNFAQPYLRDWRGVEVHEGLDLSIANFVVLLNQNITRVHPNGNATERHLEAVRVLTDTGVRYQQIRGIYFEKDREEIRIHRARVWKPDGTYIDAPRPVFRTAGPSGGQGGTVYQDYQVCILQFPGLEKGSVVEVEYEKTQKYENIYSDYFGGVEYMADPFLEPSAEREYVLITPKERDIYWKFAGPNYPESARGGPIELQREPEVTETETERVYRWTCKNLPAAPREPMMPPASEILPYIAVSTFPDWDAMIDWYWDLVKDHLTPGPVVKQRAQQVVAAYREQKGYGPEDELSVWDKVQAVNQYVNTEVRYLGLEFGIQGYRPRKVDEVCTSQYGDCKDKAALAVTLLKELGVPANMVLLRVTTFGDIDYEIPVFRGLFNHMIYYVPELGGGGYFIDGTATYHGAGELPSGDSGAYALIVEPGGGYGFKRIPHSEASENGGVYTTALALDETGAASGTRTAEYCGLFNPLVRNTYENPNKALETVNQSLAGQFPGAAASNIQLSDMDDYTTAEHLAYNLEIPNFAARRGDRLSAPVTLMEEDWSERYAQLSRREYDLVLNFPSTRVNVQKMRLPEGLKIDTLPPDRSLKTDFGGYTRTIETEGGDITVREELVLDAVRVPVEDYPAFREFCRLVDRYQEETIIIVNE